MKLRIKRRQRPLLQDSPPTQRPSLTAIQRRAQLENRIGPYTLARILKRTHKPCTVCRQPKYPCPFCFRMWCRVCHPEGCAHPRCLEREEWRRSQLPLPLPLPLPQPVTKKKEKKKAIEVSPPIPTPPIEIPVRLQALAVAIEAKGLGLKVTTGVDYQPIGSRGLLNGTYPEDRDFEGQIRQALKECATALGFHVGSLGPSMNKKNTWLMDYITTPKPKLGGDDKRFAI